MSEATDKATASLWVVVEHAKGKPHDTSAMLLRHAAVLAAQPGHPLRVCAVMRSGTSDEELTVLDALHRTGVQAVTILECEGPQDTCVPPDAADAFLRDAHPELVLLPATPGPTRLAAHLAASRDIALIADCVGIDRAGDGRLAFRVSTAGGMALINVESAARTTLALMPQREFDVPVPAAQGGPLHVTRLQCGHAAPDDSLSLISAAPVAPEDMSLAEANVIVSGGRGLGQPETFDLLRSLAAMLGGHVGASRVATDLGWIDRDHLVGMSGSTVRPALYFAIGISGAPHHLMGMREAATILALNKDPDAPIFQIATHALVGDLHEVIPKVIERLGAMRDSA
ncbi:MAG: electron transfer flavoprotein subunit alpha/FixB family protein [Pseudomonadota bacterium]